jgi:hypothetical protein
VVTILAAGSVAHALVGRSSTPAPRSNSSAVRREAAVRSLAVTWVADQITGGTMLACDPDMCAALHARHIPTADLAELRPGGTPSLRPAVIVATAAIRRQLGTRLSSAYAPAVLASFGSGNERIDIRAIARRGAAAYQATASADLTQRQESGAELLHTSRIVVAVPARARLAAGQVDSRLLVTIAELAAVHPIEVLAFGDPAPGADPDVSPLRSAELAPAPSAPPVSSAAFVKATLGFLSGQDPPFAVYSTQLARLPGGRLAVRVEFPAPSPLGLLNGAGG